MLKREFISYSEAKGNFADEESLRQILLAGELRTYIEINGGVACESFSAGEFEENARNRRASWKRRIRFIEEEGELVEEGASYTLSGWFLLDSNDVDAIVRSGKLRSFEKDGLRRRLFFAMVAPALDDASESLSDIGISLSFSVELDSSPELSQLWLRADDVAELANQSSALEVSEGKPLDPRERTTLLVIIGALAEAAKLDLSEPYKAGDIVATMLLAKKVTIGARAIGDKLKEVPMAMESRVK